jgi:hypothetical protein
MDGAITSWIRSQERETRKNAMSYTDHVLTADEIAALPASDILQWHDALDAIHDNDAVIGELAAHCATTWRPAITAGS